MRDQAAYKRAETRARAKFGFYVHLTVYVVVIAFLYIVNRNSSSEYLWVIWPAMGWGLAVIIHALRVFLQSSEPKVIDKMIEKELEKEEMLEV